MPSLTTLPRKILTHVVSFLDTETLSSRHFYEEPSQLSFSSDDTPLKALSQTSKKLRHVSAKLLFANLKLDVSGPVDGEQWLLALLARCGIKRGGVESVLIYEQSPESIIQRDILMNIIRTTNPTTLTLALPPARLAQLTRIPIDESFAREFRIPFQILRLSRPPPPPQTTESIDISPSQPASLGEDSVFGLYPWTSFSFNEGSSVHAYSAREYTQSVVPSILLSRNVFMLPDLAERLLRPSLTTVAYVAVLPIRNIIFLLNFLDPLVNLRVLRTQLAPRQAQENPAPIDDATRSRSGIRHIASAIKELAIGPRDKKCWEELRHNYDVLGDWALRQPRPECFTRFEVLDYRQETLKGILDLSFRVDGPDLGWEYDGIGVWVRGEGINRGID